MAGSLVDRSIAGGTCWGVPREHPNHGKKKPWNLWGVSCEIFQSHEKGLRMATLKMFWWLDENINGGFLKYGYPQILQFRLGFSIVHYKPTLLGISPFSEPPLHPLTITVYILMYTVFISLLFPGTLYVGLGSADMWNCTHTCIYLRWHFAYFLFFFRLCECLASVLKVASLVPAPLHSQSHRFPWSCPQSDLRLKSIQMMLPYHIWVFSAS